MERHLQLDETAIHMGVVWYISAIGAYIFETCLVERYWKLDESTKWLSLVGNAHEIAASSM